MASGWSGAVHPGANIDPSRSCAARSSSALDGQALIFG
jgi:hypothetical protein